MKLAICHPVVEPQRGGCETYISMLLNRLCRDGHEVSLYASRWDAAALPARLDIRPIPDFQRPRFLRPWRFSAACREALRLGKHDLSLGFDKVIGVDLLYPQGGLHVATVAHGRNRFPAGWQRWGAAWLRALDPAYQSLVALERRAYLSHPRPFVVAISELTRQHLHHYLGIDPAETAVLHAAIEPGRLAATDRPARRVITRQQWGLEHRHVLGLFVAVNARLKGLAPLLHSVARMAGLSRFRLGIIGVSQPGYYQRLARRLGIEGQVKFLGFQGDMRNAYFASDLLVHPTFYDPCSLVVLEAQAVGLPVVTTRANGACERLDPPADSRIIDDPHDHAQLAAAIDAFVDDDTRRAASRAAMRSAMRWTFDDHYREFMRLLGTALARKRAA